MICLTLEPASQPAARGGSASIDSIDRSISFYSVGYWHTSATHPKPPKQQQARRHQQPPSLFRDPNVPPLVRWGIPILLLANDALLLYSNLGDGATVHVRIFDGDQPDGQGRSVESAPLYTITLGRSIKDMWNAKAYFTSLLIAGACVRASVWHVCAPSRRGVGVPHRTIFD